MKSFELDLFNSKKEIVIFLFFALFIFCISLYLKYSQYQELSQNRFFHLDATIINQYSKFSKRGKPYHVLKLKSDKGYHFITTNYGDLRDLKERQVRLGIITDKISFLDFLKGFYAPSYNIELMEYKNSLKNKISNFITSQHDSSLSKELFLALFLAEPISKDLRGRVSILGISHLIAISGYHLSFLFLIFYFLFSKLYRFFQNRYFPYRNAKFDLSIFIFLLLLTYLYLLDFTPSLVRSFVMLSLGFLLFHRNIKIISFEVLFVAVISILAIKVEFLFSIGFWFSVSGVFYIYLFFRYFSHLPNWLIFIVINFWVYLLMLPIIHYIFPSFSFYQLLSPFISMIFGLFYPFEIFLHLIGFGGILDSWLEWFFSLGLDAEVYICKTPLWFLSIYIFFSLLATFKYRFTYLLFFLVFLMIIFV